MSKFSCVPELFTEDRVIYLVPLAQLCLQEAAGCIVFKTLVDLRGM